LLLGELLFAARHLILARDFSRCLCARLPAQTGLGITSCLFSLVPGGQVLPVLAATLIGRLVTPGLFPSPALIARLAGVLFLSRLAGLVGRGFARRALVLAAGLATGLAAGFPLLAPLLA